MAPKENSVIKGWPVYLVFLVLIGAVIWALKNQPLGSAFEGSGSTTVFVTRHIIANSPPKTKKKRHKNEIIFQAEIGRKMVTDVPFPSADSISMTPP